MSKAKKNPYKVTGKILSTIGWVLFGLLIATLMVSIVGSFWVIWGAWAITAPFILVGGFIALVVVCALIGHYIEHLVNKWDDAKHDWDRKNRG